MERTGVQLNDFLHWFRDGGPTMYWVLLIDVIGLASLLGALGVGIASMFMPKLRVAVILMAALIGLLSLCGFGGGMVGLMREEEKVERALVMVDPEMRDRLEVAAEAELAVLRNFSVGSTAALLFGAMVVGGLGFFAKKEESSS